MRRVFARQGSAALATSAEWMGQTAGAFGQVCYSSPLAFDSPSFSSFRNQRRHASTTTATTGTTAPRPMADPSASSEPVLAAAADAGASAATTAAAECNRFEGSPAAFVELVNACDVLVVNFTARWCKPCQEIAPEWARLRHHFASHGEQPLSSSSADGSGDSNSSSDSDSSSSSSCNVSSAAGEYGDDAATEATIKVTFIDVDISANDALSALHDIRCVPTYGCYIGGGGRAAGALSPPRPRRPVPPTEAAAKGAADNGEGSSATPSSVGEEVIGDGSRGLFGTVEGAHLDKVHAMIDAAILAAAEERRTAAEAGGSGR